MRKLIQHIFALTIFTIPFLCFSSRTDPCIKSCSFTFNGIKRTYLIHIPLGHDKTKSVPLIIALHGGHGSGKRMIDLTSGGFNILADKEDFIVVYPDGIGKNWNDGRKNMPGSYKAHNLNIDDVGFISALIDTIVKTQNADPKRIYVTGMSNGALMSHRLAIELSDKIAAAAPVCGNIPADLSTKPDSPVAIMIINGKNDPLVPYEGGYVHFKKKQLGKVISTNESVSFWIINNKLIASQAVVSKLADINSEDNCSATRNNFGNPSGTGEVVLIEIDNGGHTWPGGWQYLDEKWIGKTCMDFSACQTIWDFFKTHSK